ncbi:MAG: hypothetical protein K2M47_03415 [Clostridiales bacterium]|nr:hypothetical protein [Clostridiales bacterium]
MPVKAKRKQTVALELPYTFTDNVRKSRLGKSAVGGYTVNTNAIQSDLTYDERYKNAISAFRRESSVILDFGSPLYSLHGAFRQEAIKAYIIKVLLFVGTKPTGNGLAVLARLTEILTLHPELTLEYVIDDFAKTHAATVDAVTHIIEKYFNIYDNYFCERVISLTGSHPMTAKDVLCDLSVYVRAKYLCETRQ